MNERDPGCQGLHRIRLRQIDQIIAGATERIQSVDCAALFSRQQLATQEETP
jgi:hypothetical protein